MQTLSATLTAAQKSSSIVPYVKVQTRAESADVRILRWTRYYTGTEPAQPHAAWASGDGSLIRVRATGGTLYVQRVVSPDPGSDYATWTTLAAGISDSSPAALCGYGSTVWCFYANAAGTGVVYRTSADDGATWSNEAMAGVAGGAVSCLAAAAKDGINLVVFLAVGASVYRIKYMGAWGAVTPWANSAGSVTGLAAFYLGDYNLVVTGTDADGSYRLWQTIYGDNYSVAVDEWDALTEIVGASAGAGVEYHQPAVGRPDVYRLWYLEKYTGTAAYNRPYWSHGVRGAADYVSNVWREPVPFDLSSICGLAMASSPTQVFLSMPSGVWQAALDATVNDLTADVLEVSMDHGEREGSVQLTLRNDDGRYGTGGACAGYLGKGWQVEVSLGCVTSTGNETGAARHYWIRSWEFVRPSAHASAVVIVHAVDAWGLLSWWRARRQIAWSAGSKTRYQILQFVLGRVGLELSSIGTLSAEMGTDSPGFVIQPDESGVEVVRRLLSQVPEILSWRRATGYVRQVSAGDAASHSYGTDHAIYQGRSTTGMYPVNRAQVFGASIYGEEFAWPEIEAGGDRLEQIHDLNLDTAGKVSGRASAEKHKWELASTPGRIVAPVHCGVELYDVVTVTDPTLDLNGTKRRVMGYSVRYGPKLRVQNPKSWDSGFDARSAKAIWEMGLTLGGA